MRDDAGPAPGRPRWLPAWLRTYRKADLGPDVIAGMTTGAVVIPKALAYATIAQLPVQAGLYTACVPMAVYAIVGASRRLSFSTTATLAILVGGALARVNPSGDAAAAMAASATLALLVGAILLAGALLRFGFIADFISDPVLTGFKAGIAVVILIDQAPKLLGIHIDKGSPLHNLVAIVQGLPHTSLATLGLGVATMALIVVIERLWPRAPAPLIAVAAGIAAAAIPALRAAGVETVGHVPAGPPALTVPEWSALAALWPAALGIALMSFTESIAAGRAFADRGEAPAPANRELFASGVANVCGAFFGAMASGGGTSQTAVNRLAGARSQLAGLVSAALALAAMLLLGPLIGKMPHATLAAIVIVYSVGLIDLAEFRAILAIRRTEFIWALVAMAGVIVLGTLQGIVVAIGVSLVALARQVADPPVHVIGRKPGTAVFRPLSPSHEDDETFPGLLLLRPEGRIFFLNARHMGEKMHAFVRTCDPAVVVLDLRAVFDIEYTALRMLVDGEARLRGEGRELWLVGLTPNVFEIIRRSELGARLGTERMFFSLEQAVGRFAEHRKSERG
jgi:high affinity sulfate transporter 1